MIKSYIDPSAQITTFVCEGTVTTKEITNAVHDYYLNAPTKSLLWDFSAADISGLETQDIQDIATFVKHQAHSRSGGKTAIIAPQDLSFGMGRMYTAYAEIEEQQADVRIFRELDKALQWLKE